MSYCPNCGHEASPGARFCEYCGTRLSVPEQAPAIQTVEAQPVVTQPVAVPPVAQAAAEPAVSEAVRGDDYTVFLVSLSSCPTSMAAELIADACGYSDADALEIVRNCPIPVAHRLTERQAAYLAHAMAEYGMEVSVYNRFGYQNVTANLTTVFRRDGGFLIRVVQVIGLISSVNRLTPAMIHRHEAPFGMVPPVLYPRPRAVFRPSRRPSLRLHTLHRSIPPTPPKPVVRGGLKLTMPRPAVPKMSKPDTPGRKPAGRKGAFGLGVPGMKPKGPGGHR